MFTPVQTREWESAIADFLIHIEANRARNTRDFYASQLDALRCWAEYEGIGLSDFRKRNLDKYLVHRAGKGLKPTTVRHGAACAKSFFRWCVSNDVLDKDPLSEYRVRNAPIPARPMPTDEDVRKLLVALGDFWDLRKNPVANRMRPERRAFHRARNTAIFLGLLDTACRIGEMMEMRLDDYKEGERRILVRESKGRQPRPLPVSPLWADALASWLRIRKRVMDGHEDNGLLFVSESGGPIDPRKFIHNLHRVTAFAQIPKEINLHSLRRFSINKLAKHNLLAAQSMAGHKDTKTTLMYTRLDPDFLREMHEEVGVLRNLVHSKRPKKLV